MGLRNAAAQRSGAGRHWRGWLVVALWLCPALAAWADSVALDINGVSRALERNVERHVEQLGLTDREDARRNRGRVLHHARKALEALGYYDAQISFTLSPPEDSSVEITLDIVPGEPVLWQDTRVAFSGPGAEDPLFAHIVQAFGPKVGEVLNHQQYETLKKELRSQALANGYFDVQVRRQKLLIDRVERAARIDFELFTGERYRFGKVSFTPTTLNQKNLQRLIPFKEGD